MAQKTIIQGSPAFEIEEVDQANNLVATYVQRSSERGSPIDVIIPKNTNSYGKSILNAFLPAGYPHSVTSDYLEYQIYDSLQAFSSSIAGMLSSRAVLEGIGVGDAHASATGALLLSVLQESMGRIGTILFAHRIGTALEPECKMYRLLADVFNDAAMVLDCLSPALPKSSRVMLLSASSVLRSLCGVAAGSSKASLSAHFATQGNLGELNAKDSSQETIISLMGMLVGSVVVSHISSKWATWVALIFLLAAHLGMNYLAVGAVCMKTLNRQRANLVLSRILEGASEANSEYFTRAKAVREANGREVPNDLRFAHQMAAELSHVPELMGASIAKWAPTPAQVSSREAVFERDGVLRWDGKKVIGHCTFGVSLQKVLESIADTTRKIDSEAETLTHQLLDLFKHDQYILWYDQYRKIYMIVLKEDSAPETHLLAWMHALWMAKNTDDMKSTLHSIRDAKLGTDKLRESLAEGLQKAGWDLKISAMETRSGTRIRKAHAKTE